MFDGDYPPNTGEFHVSNKLGVVPVINIKKEYIKEIIGKGTIENPYKLNK